MNKHWKNTQMIDAGRVERLPNLIDDIEAWAKNMLKEVEDAMNDNQPPREGEAILDFEHSAGSHRILCELLNIIEKNKEG